MTTPSTVVPTELLNPVDKVPVTSEAIATFPSTNMESMEAMMTGVKKVF
jgi:hypothetical protein